jgi:hypothetical protein
VSFLEFLEALKETRLKNFIEELTQIEPLPPNLQENELFQGFKGAITENYVAQELVRGQIRKFFKEKKS